MCAHCTQWNATINAIHIMVMCIVQGERSNHERRTEWAELQFVSMHDSVCSETMATQSRQSYGIEIHIFLPAKSRSNRADNDQTNQLLHIDEAVDNEIIPKKNEPSDRCSPIWTERKKRSENSHNFNKIKMIIKMWKTWIGRKGMHFKQFALAYSVQTLKQRSETVHRKFIRSVARIVQMTVEFNCVQKLFLWPKTKTKTEMLATMAAWCQAKQ